MWQAIGPLHVPVTWYKITHAGTEVGTSKTKVGQVGLVQGTFVLEVQLSNLHPSMCDFIPPDCAKDL